MGLDGLGQRVALVDLDLDRARRDHVEQVARTRDKLVALGGEVEQHGTGGVDRAVGRELRQLDRVGRARRIAEADQVAAPLQALHGAAQRVLARRVIHDRHARAVGDLLHLLDEVLVLVVDRVVAAMGLRELGLLLAAHGADHGDAQVVQPLAGDQPDTAGRRVPQDGLALLYREAGLDQELDGHALEHHGGRLLVGDVVGQLHGDLRRHHALFGIGAERHVGIADPVADREVRDPLAHGDDLARALEPQPVRHRDRTRARAEVDVDEVEAGRGVLHADLARTGIADLDLLPLHDVRPAGLVESDRVDHVNSP